MKMKNDYLREIELNNEGSKSVIVEVEQKLGVKFPDDYKEFIQKNNGGEGSIGGYSYISIWKIEDVIELNELYEVKEYTPNFVYFGSDGGDMAYAFDFSSEECKYIEFPFMSIKEDEKIILGNSLKEMFKTLYNR